jgi:hypothetical protein
MEKAYIQKLSRPMCTVTSNPWLPSFALKLGLLELCGLRGDKAIMVRFFLYPHHVFPEVRGFLKGRAHIDCSGLALHRHFGSDTTPGALRIYFMRNITPKVQLIRDTVHDGVDPKDLDLEGASKRSGTGS